jgi:hypothetical protein
MPFHDSGKYVSLAAQVQTSAAASLEEGGENEDNVIETEAFPDFPPRSDMAPDREDVTTEHMHSFAIANLAIAQRIAGQSLVQHHGCRINSFAFKMSDQELRPRLQTTKMLSRHRVRGHANPSRLSRSDDGKVFEYGRPKCEMDVNICAYVRQLAASDSAKKDPASRGGRVPGSSYGSR